jgi:hypothetical protein
MTAPRQVPSLADVIGPAIDTLVAVRPTALPHVDQGHYGDVITGLGGQVQVSRQRVAKEAAASLLGAASGDELTELARSEFDAIRLNAPTTAIGEVYLSRPVIHYRADTGSLSFSAHASDLASLTTLVTALLASLTTHAASVYNPTTGLGSHAVAAPVPSVSINMSTGSAILSTLQGLQGVVVSHITGGRWHPTPDTTSLASATAFASAPSSPFSSQSNGSQKSLLSLANAIMAAMVAHYAKNAPAGVVPASSGWTVAADSTAVPPILGSKYTSLADVSVLVGQATATVPIEATTTGPAGNIPVASSVPGYQLTAPTSLVSDPNVNLNFGRTPIPTPDAPLFDTNLVATAIYVAGGGKGQSDPTLRVASTARFTGRYGPTPGALVAGSYASGQAAALAILEDTSTGSSYFYAADPSWATSHAWRTTIEQEIRDTWLGAGCRLLQGSFVNTPVRIEATIVLRSASYLANTSDITTAIQGALVAYFDQRPDWYVWKLSAIQGVCAQADYRILSCSLVIVKNADGLVLSEPPAPVAGQYLTHWAFSDQAFLPTYSAPV